MNDNEIKLYEIDESEIPSIITSQFGEVKRLENKVKAAMQKAEEAKKSADSAYKKSTGWFMKGKAIESLQQATVDLAESQVSFGEAQKVSFEYQEKLGRILQYMFGLGVMNLAANRTVVRQLQMQLSGASKEEMSDFAKQEIKGVIRQLKAQEDIMIKQKDLAEKVKWHEQSLKVIGDKDEEQDRLIAKNAAKDKEQDRKIAEQVQKDEEQDRRLAEQALKYKEQDRRLAEQALKDEEHDRLIAENAVKNKEQDEWIKVTMEKMKEKDDIIRSLQKECDMLKREIWKMSRRKRKN